MKTLEQILAEAQIFNIEDLELKMDGDVYQELYDFWMPSMPYGTAKARDGDPDEFIFYNTAERMGWQ